MTALGLYFICYGILALTHILIQMHIGHMEHRRQKHPRFSAAFSGHSPSVSVIVPAYNETPDILYRCIRSIADQAYRKLEILVVDDGSSQRVQLQQAVYGRFHDNKRVHMVYTPHNVGKRHAQKYGFNRCTGDIIVTVDSDTVLPPQAIGLIVQRFKDPSVGAVTGDVQVENRRVNVLTRLIGYRYWSAFHQERAAQSYFRVLMCCSGPFSAYRRCIIEQVKEKYTSQRFLGQLCTFGDDRHLTNLVLEAGYRVVFDSRALAYTHVPENLRIYLRQQVRWNKSFYREMLWTIRSYRRHHWYMLYDLSMQLLLPFLLLIALAGMAYQTVAYGPTVLVHYVLILMVIAVIRAGYGLFRTHDPGFLLFVLYGFLHVTLLIPIRFYALCTMRHTGWGTR